MTKKTLRRLEWSTPAQQKIVYDGIRYLNAIAQSDERRLSFLSFMERHVPYTEIPSHVAHGYSNAEKALWLFNRVLETHGVECIRLSEYDKRHSVYNDVVAEYCNTGETYTSTLIYRYDIEKRWDIISIGDLIELLERKGYKLA